MFELKKTWSQWTTEILVSVLSWKVLASHIDKSAWLEAQVRQLLQMASQQQDKFDLRPLMEAIDTVQQKITLLESNDQRLGMSTILYFSFADSSVCVWHKTSKHLAKRRVTAVQDTEWLNLVFVKQNSSGILATQARIMKSPEWGLELTKGRKGPGGSKNKGMTVFHPEWKITLKPRKRCGGRTVFCGGTPQRCCGFGSRPLRGSK